MKRDRKISNALIICSLWIAVLVFFHRRTDNGQIFISFAAVFIFLVGLFFRIKAKIKERDYWRNMFL